MGGFDLVSLEVFKVPYLHIYTYNVCKLRGLVRPVCMWITQGAWITSLSLAREISTSHENLSAQELVSE